VLHTAYSDCEFATCRRTHTELASHAAAKSWTARDTDMEHDGSDQAGLHDDDILIFVLV
jgi:hypothetical protein